MRDKPAVVAGFGGYPSIPALSAATILRIPRMIHEQNGVLGKVNEVFAKRVDAVACGTWPTTLPAGVEGHPHRQPGPGAVMAREGAGYIEPGRLSHEPCRHRRQPGRAHPVGAWCRRRWRCCPRRCARELRVAQQARAEDMDRVTAFYARTRHQGRGRDASSTTSRERFSEAQLDHQPLGRSRRSPTSR